VPRNTDSKITNCDTALSRCLLEGNPAAIAKNRGSRRKALGISLAIEATLLGLLIISPLLSSVAQPQFHRVAGPTFIVMGTSKVRQIQPANPTPNRIRTGQPVPVLMLKPSPELDLTHHGEPDRNDSSMVDVLGDNNSDESSLLGLAISPPKPEPPQPDHQAREEKKNDKSQRARPSGATDFARRAALSGACHTNQNGGHSAPSRHHRPRRANHRAGSNQCPPLLVPAALDAVRQWRYRPTILNGQAVDVDTSITVIFRLRQ
jgi:hypothetical protein